MIPPLFVERFSTLTSSTSVEALLSCLASVQKSLRINTHKITIDQFQQIATEHHWELSPIPWEPAGFFIDREDKQFPLGKTVEHFAGLFYLQEASSMLPARVLSPGEGDIVLDMAAAPGSKTTQMSNIMNQKGIIVSNDFSVSRTKALATNIERQGCMNVGITTINGKMMADIVPDTFDKILLDAPCSGEGTAWKDTSFFTRWSLDTIKRSAGLQKSLILSAFDALRYNGEMVYSTCTFAPEENEAVIDFLLRQRPGAKLVSITSHPSFAEGLSTWQETVFDPSLSKTVRLFPHKTQTGGFFVAHIKKEAGNSKLKEKRDFGSREKIMQTKEKKQYTVYLRKTYGIEEALFDDFVFTKVDDTVWIKPEKYLLLSRYMRMDRCGVRLLTTNSNGTLKLSSPAAWAIGQHAHQNVVSLEEDQVIAFMQGKDIRLRDTQIRGVVQESVVVKDPRGLVLGVSLFQKPSRLKNQIPRHALLSS